LLAFLVSKDRRFKHLKLRKVERLLADKAFINVSHCLTQEKGLRYEDLDARFLFDNEFRKTRARVEHFFAIVKRHKIFHYNEREKDTLDDFVHVLLNMESLKFQTRVNGEKPRYDGVELVPSTDKQRGELIDSELCTCEFVKDRKSERELMKRHRENLVCCHVGLDMSDVAPGKTSKWWGRVGGRRRRRRALVKA